MNIKWCEVFVHFVKENKKLAKKNNNNQGKLIESVSDLEIICFIICKWAHKKNQTSTERS